MDYQKHYNKLIERAKNRLLEGYTENHHIIPRCINGSNDVENIVALTPEEHYVAHQLLIKIYPNESKLVYAAHMMTVGSLKHSRNNKLYGWLRKKNSESMQGNTYGKAHKGKTSWNKGLTKETDLRVAQISKSNKGKPSPNKGRIFGPHSEESNRKRSESLKLSYANNERISWNKGKKGVMPEPWNKGLKGYKIK